jgi:transposase-like protein
MPKKSILSAPHFHDEAAALAFIEARLWPNGPVCPRCQETVRVGRMGGKSTKLGQCKCYRCRKPFAVTIGTVMESSHIPLHVWLQAMHLLCTSKKGISTHQLHRTLGVTLKSAWFLSMRIREAMKEIRGFFAGPLGGAGKTLEADETFIGPKGENRAYKPVAEKQIVMSLVERGGQVRSFHVPNVTAATLRPILGTHAHRDSRFMSDESHVYTGIGWNFTEHGTVNHSAKECVRDDVYTNTVEGYFSILKRGIYGVYQHVSEAHLKRYLAEFDFRYTNRAARGVDDVARTDLAVMGIVGKRLTYRTISGNWTAPAWPPEAGPAV